MIERGEITASVAKKALAVSVRLSITLLPTGDDAGPQNLAYLVQRDGDWSIRIDSRHGPDQHQRRHVHISKRGLKGEYSWNEDGTRHDKHRFPVSEQCIRGAKERASRALNIPVSSMHLIVAERGPVRISARSTGSGVSESSSTVSAYVNARRSFIVIGAALGIAVIVSDDA